MSGLRWEGMDLVITVRVQPRASRERWMGVRDGEVLVALTAPPVDGAANEALPKFLAKELDVATGRIRIVQGERTRHKVVRVTAPDPTRVAAWAEKLGAPPPEIRSGIPTENRTGNRKKTHPTQNGNTQNGNTQNGNKRHA
ncbi:MAG: DUF167 domain-containing protein [Magnetococcales bacterium]|nr:DUF167 domain-containing protein [Magnetococcales bacterium]